MKTKIGDSHMLHFNLHYCGNLLINYHMICLTTSDRVRVNSVFSLLIEYEEFFCLLFIVHKGVEYLNYFI